MRKFFCAGLMLVATCSAHADEFELDSTCVVYGANRTIRVDEAGGFVLSVPIRSPFDIVSLEAICIGPDGRRTGRSGPLQILENGWIASGPFIETGGPKIASIGMSANTSELTAASPEGAVQVSAVMSDSSERVVTRSDGVRFRSTDASIVGVDPNGKLSARASGTVNVIASLDQLNTAVAIRAVLSADTDGDGIPDDYELEIGLDPTNPNDSEEDRDDDGLMMRSEFELGTDPFDADTDGDGLFDGEECDRESLLCLTNPLAGDTDDDGVWDALDNAPNDSSSVDYASVIEPGSFLVAPSPLSFTKNGLGVEVSQQLTAAATMLDGRRLDLSSASRGTEYDSSDVLIALVEPDGLVVAGNDGTTEITVTNGSLSAVVPVAVGTFQPRRAGAAKHGLNGVGWDVSVAGDMAYVAVDAAGVQVFDVTDPESASNLGSFVTPGTAFDVHADDSTVYVADGSAGLSVLQFVGGASAVTRSDSFDGSFLNSTNWSATSLSGPSVEIFLAGGRLVQRLGADPNQSAEISSRGRWQLVGNFDVQVAWDAPIPIVTGSVDHFVEMTVRQGGQNWFTVGRRHFGPGQDVMHSNSRSNGVWAAGSNVSTSATSGQVRITRDDDYYTSYWRLNPDESWTQIRRERLSWTGPVEVNLKTRKSETSAILEGKFDNFEVNFGKELGDLGLVSQVPLPADSRSLWVGPSEAYVVGPSLGLAVVDVSQAPFVGLLDVDADGVDDRILARLPNLSGSEGVGFSGDLVAVARRGAGVSLIDASDPRDPQVVNTVPTVDARSVAVRDRLVVVADGNNSQTDPLKVVDVTDPATAGVVGRMADAFLLTDVATQGPYVVASDVFSVNRVPIIDLSNPAAPLFRADVDFASLGDHDGVGIDAAAGYFYMVGRRGGDNDLFIGQFAATTGDQTPPSVTMTSPLPGAQVASGSLLQISADLFDGVGLDKVVFRVNERPVATDSLSPYGTSVRVSGIGDTVKIDAVAHDLAGNTAVAAPVIVTLVQDFNPPTVEILRPTGSETVFERTSFEIEIEASDDVAVDRVEVRIDGVELATLDQPPFTTSALAPIDASSVTVEARVFDQAGNSFSDSVLLPIAQDPGTEVVGRVIDMAGAPVSGADVLADGGFSSVSDSDGMFVIPDVPSVLGAVVVRASISMAEGRFDGLSSPMHPVQGGTTDVGDVVVTTLFGDGRDGEFESTVQGQTINTAVNVTGDALPGDMALAVSDTTGLELDQEILVIQIQGSSAGTYEFGRITGLSAGFVSLAAPLVHGYSSTDLVANVVTVRNFTDVTVPEGTSIVAPSWDGQTGGVLVFRASGAVTIESGGSVDASACGFRGGNQITSVNPCSPAAGYRGESIEGLSTVLGNASPNVGGGGAGAPNSCVGCGGDSPGGGGGYGTPGQAGVNPDAPANAGRGGLIYGGPNLTDRIFLGSGGGESHWGGNVGGDGGGAVMMFAETVRVSGGSIVGDGEDGSSGSGHPSGAGSGGSVLLVADSVISDEGQISALGGQGFAVQPCISCCNSFETEIGGSGGNGRIQVRARSISAETDPALDELTFEVFTEGVATPGSIAISPGGNYGNFAYVASASQDIYRVAPDGTAEFFTSRRSGNGSLQHLFFDTTPDQRFGGHLYMVLDFFGGSCLAGIDRVLPDGTVQSFVNGCVGDPALLGAWHGLIDDQGLFGFDMFLTDFEADEFGRSPSTIIEITPTGARSPFHAVSLGGVTEATLDRTGTFGGDILATNRIASPWWQGDDSIYRVNPSGVYSQLIPNLGLGQPRDLLVDVTGEFEGHLLASYPSSGLLLEFDNLGQEVARIAVPSLGGFVQDRWGAFGFSFFASSSDNRVLILRKGAD